MMSEDFQNFAKSTVEKAGKSLKENIIIDKDVEYKKKFDLVTDMDKNIERSIVDSIQEKYPSHDIVTEEMDLERTGSEYTWYLDPISGTTNYAHGLPIFGISLALEIGDKISVCGIYNSVENKVFHAQRGKGAFVGEKKISVSEVDELEKAVVSTTFPYNERGRKRNLEHFNEVALKVEGIRRTGSVSVDLPYLACGIIDGFWAVELEPWDTAAGSLLVEESGGSITEIDGGEYDINSETFLATNGKIHDEIIECIETNSMSSN